MNDRSYADRLVKMANRVVKQASGEANVTQGRKEKAAQAVREAKSGVIPGGKAASGCFSVILCFGIAGLVLGCTQECTSRSDGMGTFSGIAGLGILIGFCYFVYAVSTWTKPDQAQRDAAKAGSVRALAQRERQDAQERRDRVCNEVGTLRNATTSHEKNAVRRRLKLLEEELQATLDYYEPK